MREALAAICILAFAAPATAASRYCALHDVPRGGAVVMVTATLNMKPLARVDGAIITSGDVFRSSVLRAELADASPTSAAAFDRVDAEELARLTAEAGWSAQARRRHVTISPRAVDARIAILAPASGDTAAGLKARLDADYPYFRTRVAAAIIHARLTGEPFAFAYHIAPPPLCRVGP